MKYGNLIIDTKEHELLRHLISSIPVFKDKSYRTAVHKIGRELAKAEKVEGTTMPRDIIRMNSIVNIEAPGNLEQTYQIVAPEKSDLKNNRISVLAPMSLALFGRATGDEIEWQFPRGTNTIKIVKVVQSDTKLKATAI